MPDPSPAGSQGGSSPAVRASFLAQSLTASGQLPDWLTGCQITGDVPGDPAGDAEFGRVEQGAHNGGEHVRRGDDFACGSRGQTVRLPNHLSHGQPAAGKGDQRIEALRLAEIFRANVVDSTLESFVFEMTGTPEKIDAFAELMRPLGLREIARTGVAALSRGA